MIDITMLMMRLIKSEISQCEVYDFSEINELELNALYAVSKKNDTAQMLASPLEKISALKSEYAVSDRFRKSLFSAVYRYEKSEYDLNNIYELFEKENIDYIPLKGVVLRNYYPTSYLRTSCDIDILIRYEDIERASELLVNKLQFNLQSKEQYDISFFSPSGVHIELHFKLVEYGFKEVKSLCDIWEGDEVFPITCHRFQMSSEFFLLYHIYHTAKHFIHGGCGIKPFIDLWVIQNKIGYDEEKVEELLKDSDLLLFYNRSMELMNVWFENKPHNAVTQEMENYILQGGVYGTLEQHLAMSQNKKGGKFRHVFSKVFLSYNSMIIYYPSLKKYPILFPLYQVRRWFRIAFCGGRKRALNEMKMNQNLSQLKKEQAKRLIDELGL